MSYPPSWKIKHKLMRTMQEQDSQCWLQGIIQVVIIGFREAVDACFGGELSGGRAVCGSENKVPFVADVAMKKKQVASMWSQLLKAESLEPAERYVA